MAPHPNHLICCVGGCRNRLNNPQYSFFTLPKNPERARKWLKVIGRPDLLARRSLNPNSYKICSAHFKKSMITEVCVRKLLPEAEPTKSLPSADEVNNASVRITVSTQTPILDMDDEDESCSDNATTVGTENTEKETGTSEPSTSNATEEPLPGPSSEPQTTNLHEQATQLPGPLKLEFQRKVLPAWYVYGLLMDNQMRMSELKNAQI